MSNKHTLQYAESLPFAGFNILFVILFLYATIQFILLAVAYTPELLAELVVSFIIASLFLGITLNFYALKISLTKDFIEARFGLFSRRIPIKEINSAVIHKYKFTDFWGWGIRRSLDGRSAYNVTGDHNTGLLITYSHNNKQVSFFMSSKNPALIINKLKEFNKSIE